VLKRGKKIKKFFLVNQFPKRKTFFTARSVSLFPRHHLDAFEVSSDSKVTRTIKNSNGSST